MLTFFKFLLIKISFLYICNVIKMVRDRQTYKIKKAYSGWQQLSSVFMLFTLLLLTVSAPIGQMVNEKLSKKEQAPLNQTIEENVNPYAGMNEEKHGGSSDYLHDAFLLPEIEDCKLSHVTYFAHFIYLKYCGELVSPPPEAC